MSEIEFNMKQGNLLLSLNSPILTPLTLDMLIASLNLSFLIYKIQYATQYNKITYSKVLGEP